MAIIYVRSNSYSDILMRRAARAPLTLELIWLEIDRLRTAMVRTRCEVEPPWLELDVSSNHFG